ncbi:MAG TPA: trypsin-like peptidase domain-containing protein [Acidimicrobiales bacterium]|nr:trypsin-like peptidase domain-containing protein [Acidimicrobiales bacterium]
MEHSETDGPATPDPEVPASAPQTSPPPAAAAMPLGPVTTLAEAPAPAGDRPGTEAPAATEPTSEVAVPGAGKTDEIPAVAPPSGAPFLPPQWREPGVTAESPDAQASEPTPPWGAQPAVVPIIAPAGYGWSPDLPPPAPAAGGSTGNRAPGWRWAIVSLAAALIGALIGGGIVAVSNNKSASTTVKEISAGPALLNGVTNIESVIAKVLPAVVSIDATSPASASQSIFGGTSGGVQEDQGTGMIITSNGEVVTNNHVISGATTITVTLFGSLKALPATLVETDPANDVALLQITNASNLPTVTYGNSDHVQVGDAVVAIGNALGLSAGTPTVTQGIISAKGRTVQASDSTGAASETLTNMFQTDAAINPGNSGGPLVDSSGKVIGMNTAVASSADGTSQAQNIGFAIPSNKIQQELPELRNKSVPNPATSGSAYLGVSLETLTPELRSQYNFVPTQGAVVLQVQSGSPADAAGLQQGDVITSFSGKTVTSADQLASAIQAEHPGKTVTIGLYRGQTQMTVKATLGSASQNQQSTGG